MDKEQNNQGAPDLPQNGPAEQPIEQTVEQQPETTTQIPVQVQQNNNVAEQPSEPVEQSAASQPENPLQPSEPESQGTTSPPEDTLPAMLPITPPKAPNNRKKIILSILAVVIVAILAVGAWLVLAEEDKPANKNAVQQSTTIDVVKVGALDGPIGTDYIFPKPNGADMSMAINYQVFEGLIGYNDNKYVPLLATSWTNPDNNTWVFEIKQNVKFQNGKTLAAVDVKNSLDALVKDEAWSYYLPTIKDVTVSGPSQVTVKTITPDSLLLNRLTYGFIYSENADKTVSGTGAYTVDATNSKTEDKTRLVAFDGYHQGTPKTRAVEYTVYDTPENFNKALSDGAINIGKDIKDESLATELAKKNVQTYNYDSTGAYGILINMTKPTSPLAKKEVREALAYAIDRNAYITAAKSSRIATNYIIPKAVVGYDEKAKFPDVNVAKAKDLLTKAGYPNGVPLTFNYIDGIQADVPILIEQLNKAGFTITAKAFPSPNEFVAAGKAANYDLLALSYSSDFNDGTDVFSGLLSSKASQFPSYNNPAYDKLLLDAVQAFKPAEHVQKVQEVNRFTTDNSLWIPIANRVYTTYYPKSYDYKVDSNTGLGGTYYWKLGASPGQSSSK